MPHRWRNESQLPVRWVEMQAPGPRSAYHEDTFVVPGPPYQEAANVDGETRAIVTSGRSRRHRWTPPSRARTCSTSRRACALRSLCMEGSM